MNKSVLVIVVSFWVLGLVPSVSRALVCSDYFSQHKFAARQTIKHAPRMDLAALSGERLEQELFLKMHTYFSERFGGTLPNGYNKSQFLGTVPRGIFERHKSIFSLAVVPAGGQIIVTDQERDQSKGRGRIKPETIPDFLKAFEYLDIEEQSKIAIATTLNIFENLDLESIQNNKGIPKIFSKMGWNLEEFKTFREWWYFAASIDPAINYFFVLSQLNKETDRVQALSDGDLNVLVKRIRKASTEVDTLLSPVGEAIFSGSPVSADFEGLNLPTQSTHTSLVRSFLAQFGVIRLSDFNKALTDRDILPLSLAFDHDRYLSLLDSKTQHVRARIDAIEKEREVVEAKRRSLLKSHHIREPLQPNEEEKDAYRKFESTIGRLAGSQKLPKHFIEELRIQLEKLQGFSNPHLNTKLWRDLIGYLPRYGTDISRGFHQSPRFYASVSNYSDLIDLLKLYIEFAPLFTLTSKETKVFLEELRDYESILQRMIRHLPDNNRERDQAREHAITYFLNPDWERINHLYGVDEAVRSELFEQIRALEADDANLEFEKAELEDLLSNADDQFMLDSDKEFVQINPLFHQFIRWVYFRGRAELNIPTTSPAELSVEIRSWDISGELSRTQLLDASQQLIEASESVAIYSSEIISLISAENMTDVDLHRSFSENVEADSSLGNRNFIQIQLRRVLKQIEDLEKVESATTDLLSEYRRRIQILESDSVTLQVEMKPSLATSRDIALSDLKTLEIKLEADLERVTQLLERREVLYKSLSELLRQFASE